MNALPPRLRARHRVDIGPGDLLWGLGACVLPRDPIRVAHEVERQVDPDGEVLATLSVRSGFDLLLTALDLPAGDEILLSALTIPDMARLVRAHGLVPVPVDVDPDTLSPRPDALEQACSPRSRVLMVAQLFGGSADLAAAADVAARRGLLLVDDAAQGYTGPASLAGSPADVTFHSFGSIKTATCLGGGLVRVRDPDLRARMRVLHDRWPVQSPGRHARKLALYTALLASRRPRAYGAFARACAGRGGLDAVIMGMTRGFPAATAAELQGKLRRRPCGPLLRLLGRRLRGFDPGRLERRRLAGEIMLAGVGEILPVLGCRQAGRTHWLFAALPADPDVHIARLRAAGFDAARGATSITALSAPPERPDTEPPAARRAMERILFLPVYPEIPADERARLARILVES